MRHLPLHLLIVLLLAPFVSVAQPGPTLTLTNEVWPSRSLSDAEIDGADATLDGATLSTVSTGLAATYPFILRGGRTVLVPRLSVQQLRFDHDGWPQNTPAADEAYLIDLGLSVQHQLSTRWALRADLNPSLASDLDRKLDEDDFVLQGAAMALWQATPRFTMGFGAAYSTVFGTPVPVPLLLLQHRGQSWRAEAFLPASIEAWWVPSQRVELGLAIEALGSRHRLGAEEALFDHPFAEALTLTVGPSLNVRPAPWLQLGIDSGVSLYRQVRVTDGDDEVNRYEPDPTAFIRTRLTFGR
ncbi:MAG: DUF6268 family outer membrane beta-barrel protein [Bacteroidota bacterium]